MEFLRFGVVGVNGMGGGHLRTLAQNLPYAKLTAICDTNLDIANKRKEELGLDVPVFQDFEDMLANADIDAVTLATPHYLHAPHAILAANAGKHILTEKPLAISVSEGDAMIAAAKKNGVLLGVGHQRRWSGAMRGMRDLIKSGKLGAPMRSAYNTANQRNEHYYASGTWRGRWDQEGGGQLINQQVHDMDALCYMLGKPVEVMAWAENWAHKHEVDDVSMAIVKFDSGWTGTINISLSSVGGWGPSLIAYEGDLGVISNGKVAMRSEGCRDFIATSTTEKPSLSEFEDIPPVEMDIEGRDRYYRDMLESVNTGAPFEGSGEECIHAVELVNAIFLSALTGRRVQCPLDRGEVDDMFAELREKETVLARVR